MFILSKHCFSSIYFALEAMLLIKSFFQILRISQQTGQMRLSCRKRSVESCEDIMSDKFNDDSDDEERQEDVDENTLRERQCSRRMAVVLD